MDEFLKIAATQFFEKLSQSEDMQKTIARLEKLDKEPPDPDQLKRYSLLGAGVAPLVTLAKDTIQSVGVPGRTILPRITGPDGVSRIDKGTILRRLASDALMGAVTTGLLPVVRHRMDRDAEMTKLRNQIAAAEKSASALIPSSSGSPAQRLAAARRIGSARMTNLSGPSIAQVSRTMGPIQPGAAKGTL